MTAPLTIYMSLWIAACIIAITLILKDIKQLELFQFGYRSLLFQPWKITTFLVATIGMAIIAPYTGDPTWDYYDSTFMCVLTYLTAPWVIGIIYRKIRGETSWVKTYIAVCIWMFSASWSYDLYIVLRDGFYPTTWLPNIFASSVLYVCAGLLWNLEWHKGRGVIFGFMLPNWPEHVFISRPYKIMWFALPVIVFVVALTASFFL